MIRRFRVAAAAFSLDRRTPRRSNPAGGRRDRASVPASFHAVDFELANREPWSICQTGIVRVRDGRVVDRWSSLVNPQARF